MSDSDYDVEEYIKPTVKRSTYDKEDDNYLSDHSKTEEEEDESENSEIFDENEKIKSHEVKKVNEKDEEVEEEKRTSCRLILHVSNLAETTTKQMLELFFSDSGEIKSVRIPRKRGLSNFAFVEMKDMDSYKVSIKKLLNNLH